MGAATPLCDGGGPMAAIDLTDLANLLAAPAEERAATLAAATAAPGFLTVKVGIGAAMIAVAVLMRG